MSENTNLLVLGSAAAEGIPAIFCDCRVCREAIKRGGREVRARTSYNFGGDVQIDLGPDSLQAWQNHPDVLSKMRHVLITHAHEDHFQPSDFVYHSKWFASAPAVPWTITIHGTEPTKARMMREFWLDSNDPFQKLLEYADVSFAEFKQFDSFALNGCDGFVRTFAADHAQRLEPCVFLITLRGRTVFICNDTGWLPDDSWAALEKLRGEVSIDVVVLDNTGMLKGVPGISNDEVWTRGHMSAPTCLKVFDKLDSMGLLASGCVRAVNHFSHNGGFMHDELESFYTPHGVRVCHDGTVL